MDMSTGIRRYFVSFTCSFVGGFIPYPLMDKNISIKYVTRSDGVRLAYRFREGQKDAPTVVFLSGYHSDMEGTKAVAVDGYCAAHHIPCLRLDYSGHGQSGGEFRDGTIGEWTIDALTVIRQVTRGPLIIIGSSMGGWIGLLVARQIPERIRAYIGVSAAPDFTDWVWHSGMDDAARELCRRQGYIATPDGDVMTLRLFEEGAQHLLLKAPLVVPFPVMFLHGAMDTEVPVAIAEKLAQILVAPSVQKTIIPDGTHRLARDTDITALLQLVAQALVNPPANP